MARKPAIKMNGQQRRKLGNWLEDNWERIHRNRIHKPEAARIASDDLGFEVTVAWLQTVTKDLDKEGWHMPSERHEPLDRLDTVTEIAALLCTITADLCEQVEDLGIDIKGAKALPRLSKALKEVCKQ